MTQYWPIPGGIHPPERKEQSLQLALADIPLPKELILPLNQHIGNPTSPCVAVGDKVFKGQIIAQAEGVISANIHASSSGVISAIEERPIAHPSGMLSQCIVIQTDAQDRWVNKEVCADYTELAGETLLETIRSAGIVGLGGAGFPTATKLHPNPRYTIDTLILNGAECEPYITADDILMQEYADQVIAGAQLLAHILGGPQRVLVGIEDNKPAAIRAMQEAAKGSKIKIVAFPTKYPSGGEKQLIQILTGKEVPSGSIPAVIGIVMQNVGTAVAAYRAVRYGEPLISRITTVVGQALEQQRNVQVLLGTPIQHVLEHCGFKAQDNQRLIHGGPMMGFTLQNPKAPVIKITNCILAPSAQELPPAPPAQACIRCGLCAEACPATLLPQQLFWYAQAEDFDKLQSHNLFDCIECGACAYVCPSNIPLVQYYRASKDNIRQQQVTKENSDRARQRFESRKIRLEKAEAEKEAKRLARKQAAEAAKQKLANKDDKPETDLVATAMARAQSKADSSEQRPRLERSLSSAQNRLQRAQAQWQEAEQQDESQLEKLAARVKQAEQKVREAQAKLDKLDD